MRTLKEDLQLMDTLHGEGLDKHLYEMKARYVSPQDQEAIRKHIDKELTQIEYHVESLEQNITIREQMREIIELVPIAYVAKNYFGKSRAWLYQRINGYKVRGRVYTFNDKEIEVFNQALKEIGNKIGFFTVG